MTKFLSILLFLTAPLAAQTIAPSQIKPGTDGQVITTAGGKTAWGAAAGAGVSSVFGRTGVVTAQSGDYLCSQVTGAICSLPSLNYQTIKNDGAAVTQRPSLNLIPGTAGSVSCVDNPVTNSTDCTITGGSSTGITWSIADMTGSRYPNVVYQNTSTNLMFIGGSLQTGGGGTGNILVAQGLTSGYLPFVSWANESTASVSGTDAGFSAVIMPGYYYTIRQSGTVHSTVLHWTQITGTGTAGGGGGSSTTLALTTTGSSGASTLTGNQTAGYALNIPQYAGGTSFPTGAANQMLYYAANGTAVTPLTLGANLSISAGVLNATGGTGAPGGGDTDVQFSDGGAFGGQPNYTFNKATGLLSVPLLSAKQPIAGVYDAGANNTGGSGSGFNGVQNSINAIYASGPSNTGTIIIPPGAQADQPSIDGATESRLGFMDFRQGAFSFSSIDPGSDNPYGNGPANFSIHCFNRSAPVQTGSGPGVPTRSTDCLDTEVNVTVPGYSYGATGNYQGGAVMSQVWNTNANFYGAGINKGLISAAVNVSGKGDSQMFNVNFTNTYGGQDEGAGEGTHFWRGIEVIGGDYTATAGATGIDMPADGYVQLQLHPIGGALGVLRILLDTTTATTDTVTADAPQSDGSNALTMALSTYPVSTLATLSTDIAPPGYNVEEAKTSETFTVATGADLTSKIGEQFQFNTGRSMECGVIQSVGAFGGGSQTVTAMLGDFHGSGATMYIGGMACHFIIPDNTVIPQTSNTHSTWYILGSTANNTLVGARIYGARPDPYIAGTPGPVHIYQGARVLDVRCNYAPWCPNGVAGVVGAAVRVEETNATWNSGDSVLSGLMATSANDTVYYNFTDNSPMSSGSTYWDILSGAQAGGFQPRDYRLVQNTMQDSDYTWGGGPFTMGYMFDWKGPIGGVFKFDHALHAPFITEDSCGTTLITGSASGQNNAIKNICSGIGGQIGWEISGATQFTSGTSHDVLASIAQGAVALNVPTTVTSNLTVTPTSGAALTLTSGDLDVTSGNLEMASGNLNLRGASAYLYSTAASPIFDPTTTSCVLGADGFGHWGCNTNPFMASTVTATTAGYPAFSVQNSGQTIGGFGNDLGAFNISSSNCSLGGNCGQLGLIAAKQLELEAAPDTNFGGGGIVARQYIAGDSGLGLILRSNTDGGSTGSPIELQVSDYADNTFQTVLQANGVTTSGAKAGLSLAPNGGTTTVGGDLVVTGTCTGCGGGGGGSGISGQSGGYAIEAATATTATGPFPMDDSITAANTITMHKALAIADGTGHNGMGLPVSTSLPTPVAGAGIFSDASGDLQAYEAGGTFSRLCTVGNGLCASSGGGIANATTTVGTTAIAANTCATAVTVTMTGTTTTTAFTFTPNADVSGVTGWGSTGGLAVVAWPTTNTLNYKVCNQTSSSITPSASVTFNVSAK